MKFPRWRKMTWALIGWSVLMTVWIIGGAASTNCGQYADEASKSGCQAGTGIGVGLLIGLWFMGFVILSLIWFMTRPKPESRAQPQATPQAARGWYTDPDDSGSYRYWNGLSWTEHRSPKATSQRVSGALA